MIGFLFTSIFAVRSSINIGHRAWGIGKGPVHWGQVLQRAGWVARYLLGHAAGVVVTHCRAAVGLNEALLVSQSLPSPAEVVKDA